MNKKILVGSIIAVVILILISSSSAIDVKIERGNQPPEPPYISGPHYGETGVEYNYTFVIHDPDGDDIWYKIDWGDGNVTDWIGPKTSDEEIIRSHSWSEKGLYEIRAKAKDIFDAESRWSDPYLVIIGYRPPSRPIIDGPTSGRVGVEYEYTFNSTDGDVVIYLVHWGDDSPGEIVVPIPQNPDNGNEATANHSWDTKGTYIISAKARDIWGAESEWGTLEVTMPKNHNMWFQWLDWFPLLNQLIMRLVKGWI